MSRRREPRKPSQPPAFIVFPKKGSVRKVVEPLPETKAGLETRIVEKFIGAMKYYEGRELSGLGQGSEWPDFEAFEGGHKVGIEVVEVVNIDHARKRGTQEDYLRRIRELIDDIYPQLAGLRIQLEDGYQDPPYPSIKTRAGQRLAGIIADGLRSAVEDLQGLAVDHFGLYWWQKGADVPTAGAVVDRLEPADAGAPAILRYPGSFWTTGREMRELLRQAIQAKLDKEYQEYSGGSLWIVAYEVASFSVGQKPSEAADLARSLLASRRHPFDEVWYFYPYPDQDLGHIERVWP